MNMSDEKDFTDPEQNELIPGSPLIKDEALDNPLVPGVGEQRKTGTTLADLIKDFKGDSIRFGESLFVNNTEGKVEILKHGQVVELSDLEPDEAKELKRVLEICRGPRV